MTVSNTTNKTSAAGNGVTTDFSFSYKIFEAANLEVYDILNSTGVATLKTLNTDYTVAINTSTEGGTVTFLSAPASGHTVFIKRVLAFDQDTDIPTESNFPEEAVENRFDYITMLAIQQKEEIARAIKLKNTSSLTDITIEDPVAGKILLVDDDGNIVMSDADFTDIQADLETVAGIAANVTTVAGISAAVSTVAGISGNVTTVAGISADVSAVAAIDTDVSAVAAIDTDVSAVATIAANVTTVAGNTANINTVAGISSNVTTVAGISSAVSNVSSISAAVSNVSSISAAVSNVSSISAAVSTVSGISGNVTTVAGISSAVSNVSSISAAVSTVSGISANVTTVAGMSANIASVVANMTDIQNAASFNFPTLVSGDARKALRINATYDGYEVVNLWSNRNLLFNPQGRVSQQATSITSSSVPANTDDTYILDVINLVSDGNNAANFAQETTTVPTGSPMSIKATQQTANKQWGLLWFLPAQESAKIIGDYASLQFKARKGGSNSTLGKLRAAIISWSSTADSITSDVVGTWAGAGTNPTLASNWSYENTPSDLTLTTSFQTFRIENVAIDTASTKNVAAFIWLDDTNATVNDIAYIADVQLEQGNVCTPFDCRPMALEQIAVKWLFETHEGSSISFLGFSGSMEGSARGNVQIPFLPKRTTPTLSSSAATTFLVAQGVTNAQGSSIIDLSWQSQITCASLDVQVSGSPFTNGYAARITGYNSTLTYVRADSRL